MTVTDKDLQVYTAYFTRQLEQTVNIAARSLTEAEELLNEHNPYEHTPWKYTDLALASADGNAYEVMDAHIFPHDYEDSGRRQGPRQSNKVPTPEDYTTVINLITKAIAAHTPRTHDQFAWPSLPTTFSISIDNNPEDYFHLKQLPTDETTFYTVQIIILDKTRVY